MQIGIVGLGKMGAGMAQRWLRAGHSVVGYDREPAAMHALAPLGMRSSTDLAALVQLLAPPRAIWLLLPAGPVTASTLAELSALLSSGDSVIDGGNSHFHDSMRHAEELAAQGLHFIDQGTSGGVWGEQQGYCLMLGGEVAAIARLDAAFQALAPERGYAHVGPAGAGHFAKMVHNGIEYGMMQAYAEGFALLRAMPNFNFDLHQLAVLWNQGSVVRSWLLELAAQALQHDADLHGSSSAVADSGEGRWMAQAAIEAAVPLPVITLALMQRFSSRQNDAFSMRLLSALRHGFGGHGGG